MRPLSFSFVYRTQLPFFSLNECRFDFSFFDMHRYCNKIIMASFLAQKHLVILRYVFITRTRI